MTMLQKLIRRFLQVVLWKLVFESSSILNSFELLLSVKKKKRPTNLLTRTSYFYRRHTHSPKAAWCCFLWLISVLLAVVMEPYWCVQTKEHKSPEFRVNFMVKCLFVVPIIELIINMKIISTRNETMDLGITSETNIPHCFLP